MRSIPQYNACSKNTFEIKHSNTRTHSEILKGIDSIFEENNRSTILIKEPLHMREISCFRVSNKNKMCQMYFFLIYLQNQCERLKRKIL